MAEWSNAHDSKSCYVGTRTGVRIPLSAPQKRFLYKGPFFVAIAVKYGGMVSAPKGRYVFRGAYFWQNILPH